MQEKPLHYDGSFHNHEQVNDEKNASDLFKLTDDARMNIRGNPFVFEEAE